jgi:methanogenic corrinoid protein MtbC1
MTMTSSPVPSYTPVNLDREYLAGKALDHWREKHPKIWRNSSASQRTGLLDDLRIAIRYLEGSLATRSPAIFIDYACGLEVHAAGRHLPAEYVSSLFATLENVIQKELPPDFRGDEAGAILRKSISVMAQAPRTIPSFIRKENPLAAIAQSYLDALLGGDREKAGSLIDEAIGSGSAVKEVYLNVIEPSLRETGRLWQMREITIAQEHYVSASTQEVIARLHDRIRSSAKRAERERKTLVAASVADELHDIGIRIVADFFEMDGWDTYYTGANTPAESLLSAIRDRRADAVAISCTMPFHIPVVHYLIRSLRADPMTKTVKILVGGYPFSIVPGLWKQIGADACARDAGEAVTVVNMLVAA